MSGKVPEFGVAAAGVYKQMNKYAHIGFGPVIRGIF